MENNSFFSPQKIGTVFWAFCLIHLFCWTLVPSLIAHAPPMDVLENINWGSVWQWGYDKDPFLAAWLAYLFSFISRSSLWPLFLLSQLCVMTSFFFVFRLGKKIFPPTVALLAVILLEGVVYYQFTSPEFNDNVLEIPLWAGTLFYFYQALDTKKTRDWFLTAFFSALSLMAKYYSAILLFSMLFYLIGIHEGRLSLRKPAPYFACFLFLLLISPNLFWLLTHHAVSISYAFSRATEKFSFFNHFLYSFEFLFSQISAALPALLIFLIFISETSKPAPILPFQKRFILFMALCPFILTLLFPIFSGYHMRSMWGTPLFNLLGLMLFTLNFPDLSKQKFNSFLWGFSLVFILALFAYALPPLVEPHFNHEEKLILFPGKEMADRLTKQWHDRYHSPLKYVAGPRWTSGLMSFYSKDHPVPFFEWDLNSSAWIDEGRLKKEGALFVWDAFHDETLAADILRCYPCVKTYTFETFSWRSSAKIPPAKIGVAFCEPEKQ